MNAAVEGRRPRCRLSAGLGLTAAGAILLGLAAMGVGQPAPAPAKEPTEEYSRLVDRAGFIERGVVGGVPRTLFRSEDRKWSAVLLPNQILAALEDRVWVAERPPQVRVTGMITEYRGRVYLLLTAASVGPSPPPAGG